jgi:hypothetical protein
MSGQSSRGTLRLIGWCLFGGVWGAWVGFQGVFQYSGPATINHDTAAPVFVWGMFVVFAAMGFLAGAATASAVGGAMAWGLRRLGVPPVATVIVALLATGGGCYGRWARCCRKAIRGCGRRGPQSQWASTLVR